MVSSMSLVVILIYIFEMFAIGKGIIIIQCGCIHALQLDCVVLAGPCSSWLLNEHLLCLVAMAALLSGLELMSVTIIPASVFPTVSFLSIQM